MPHVCTHVTCVCPITVTLQFQHSFLRQSSMTKRSIFSTLSRWDTMTCCCCCIAICSPEFVFVNHEYYLLPIIGWKEKKTNSRCRSEKYAKLNSSRISKNITDEWFQNKLSSPGCTFFFCSLKCYEFFCFMTWFFLAITC